MFINWEKRIKKLAIISEKEEIIGTFTAIRESKLLRLGLLIAIVINTLSGDVVALLLSFLLFFLSYFLSAQETKGSITNIRLISTTSNRYWFLSKVSGILMLIYTMFEGTTRILRAETIVSETNIRIFIDLIVFFGIPSSFVGNYVDFIKTNVAFILVLKSAIGFANGFWFSFYVLRRRPEVSFGYLNSISEVLVTRKKRSNRFSRVLGSLLLLIGILSIGTPFGIFLLALGFFLISVFRAKYVADFQAENVSQKHFPALATMLARSFLFSPPEKIDPKTFPISVIPTDIGDNISTSAKQGYFRQINKASVYSFGLIGVLILGLALITTIPLSFVLRLGFSLVFLHILWVLFNNVVARRIKDEQVLIGDTLLLRSFQNKTWIIRTGNIIGTEFTYSPSLYQTRYAVHSDSRLGRLFLQYKPLFVNFSLIIIIGFLLYASGASSRGGFISRNLYRFYFTLSDQYGSELAKTFFFLIILYVISALLATQYLRGKLPEVRLIVRNSPKISLLFESSTTAKKALLLLAQNIMRTSRPFRRPRSRPP